MKLKSEYIIQSKIFAEICQPKRIIEIPEMNAYLIYHTYSLSRPGTNLWNTKRMLTLYGKDGLKLTSHVNIKYPINNLAYDAKSNSILLTTGQYDGGHSFNGELLKWSIVENKLSNIVKDNREFRNIKIVEDKIVFDVLPNDDSSEDQTIKQYCIKKNTEGCYLNDFDYLTIDTTSESNFELDTSRNIEAVTSELNNLGQNYDASFKHKYSANCIKSYGENQIVIGFNNSEISILNTLDLSQRSLTINEEAHCYQIIHHGTDELILNFFPIWPPNNFAFQLARNNTLERLPKIQGLIYSNFKNYFIKQIEQYPFKDNLNDLHLDKNFKLVNKLRIGNYNGYQHHLNVSTEFAFYFFQGIDDYNYSKLLVEYSTVTNSLNLLYEFKENEKVVNTNGVVLDNILYITCTEAFGKRTNMLLKFDLESKILIKLCELESQIIELSSIDVNIIFFLDVEGEIGIIELNELKVSYLNEYLDVKNQTPISFELDKNRLLIGYNSGTLEILKIK